LLGILLAHVRNLRVKIPSNICVTASVDAVADATVLDEVFVSLSDHFGRLLLARIRQTFCVGWSGNLARIERHRSLHPRGLLTRTKSMTARVYVQTAKQYDDY
jgi:hypothetical protein